MEYLHLTLTHFKCQSKGHTDVDCEYFVNGDRESKYYYCRHIGSRLLALECYIYSSPWAILKVKVKVMQILTAIISSTVTNRKSIAITKHR